MGATARRPKAGATRQTKTFTVPVQFKADEDKPGAFRATFSLFNVKDLDGDVTLPGAFKVGAPVRIAQWGHNWGAPAIGTGTIDADDTSAWVDGQFNLNMTAGKETYESVKASGELQQWSYGFDIDEWSVGKFEGEEVLFLKALTVHEVSPVMLGAQPLTSTDRIKAMKRGGEGVSVKDVLSQVVDHMKQATGLMESLIDDDAGDEGEDDEASKSKRSKATIGTRETLATRVAMELLELSD